MRWRTLFVVAFICSRIACWPDARKLFPIAFACSEPRENANSATT